MSIIIYLSVLVQKAHAQDVHINGRITDATTHESISGAIILVRETNRGTDTDKNGEFNLLIENTNTVTLYVSHVGYAPHLQKIENEKGKTKTVEIQLRNLNTPLEEVVVTGTGTEHRIQDAPVKTEVISKKTIKEMGSIDVEEILGTLMPSFTYHKSDMGSNLKVNGLKNDYLLIMIDGKRMNGDIGGQNDLARINIEQIERIEIVKGAASSLYGSDAIGGVVNIITKNNISRLELTNTTRIGRFNEMIQNNSIGIKNKRWNSTTSLNFNHTGGWTNTHEEWYRNNLYQNSVTKTINKSTNYSLSEKLTFQASPQFYIEGNASVYEKLTERPMGIPQWRLNDLFYRNMDYAIDAKKTIGTKDFISGGISYGRYNYYYDYNSREYTDYFDDENNRIVYYTGDRILQTSQERVQGYLKSVFYLGKVHTFSSGAEYFIDFLRAPHRLPTEKADAYSASIYAQDEWKISNALIVTAGLRWGHYKETGQTITPKITGMYKFKNIRLRATYSHGFKTPTIKELYYQYYATIMSSYKAYYGNTGLKPQTSNYYSLSIEHNTDRVKIDATIYLNHISNMIALQRTPTSYEDKVLLVEETMKYVNMAKAYSMGVDITAELKLPHQFSCSSGYSYLDAKAQRTDDEAADDYMKYLRINGTSAHNASMKVAWYREWNKYKLTINLIANYQSKKYYLTDGNTKAYHLWRINTIHRMIKTKRWNMDVNAGIDNLLNDIDHTPHGLNKSTTSPGRNLFASITIRYKND